MIVCVFLRTYLSKKSGNSTDLTMIGFFVGKKITGKVCRGNGILPAGTQFGYPVGRTDILVKVVEANHVFCTKILKNKTEGKKPF